MGLGLALLWRARLETQHKGDAAPWLARAEVTATRAVTLDGDDAAARLLRAWVAIAEAAHGSRKEALAHLGRAQADVDAALAHNPRQTDALALLAALARLRLSYGLAVDCAPIVARLDSAQLAGSPRALYERALFLDRCAAAHRAPATQAAAWSARAASEKSRAIGLNPLVANEP